LLAPNEIERDRWVRVLDYFIILCKKRKGVLPETDEYSNDLLFSLLLKYFILTLIRIMRNYFQIADKSKDKTITVNEITKFLESINLKLKKDQLKSLITVIKFFILRFFNLFQCKFKCIQYFITNF
jgi:hypothetical protein